MLTWKEVLDFAKNGSPSPENKVVKSDDYWKNHLEPDVYQITRKKGTEMPFSSEMCHSFEAGKYQCACCESLLFDSSEKFDSRTGWPSFSQPINDQAVAYHKDVSFGMTRIEALCNTCDAHLGHVFEDGPPPSGLRFCINALSIQKIK